MIRLLADENFEGPIYRGVLAIKPDADFIRAQDTVMLGADDPDLLAWAATEERLLLTHDVNTMPGHAYDRVRDGLPMTGVFIVNQDAPIKQIIEQIVLLIECSSLEEWQNRVEFLPM